MQTSGTFPQLTVKPQGRKPMAKKLSAAKAKEMLHNPPGGKALSKKQRGFFGSVASGSSKMVPVPQHGSLSNRRSIAHKKAAASR